MSEISSQLRKSQSNFQTKSNKNALLHSPLQNRLVPHQWQEKLPEVTLSSQENYFTNNI
jgi:hypothetical protein